mgnify:CR=1 FL=1
MVDVPEVVKDNLIINCGYKTIKSFLLTKDFKYDYIFRTNSSSYVDKKLLLNFVSDKPKTKYYSGLIGYHGNIAFASGSGFFISKDLVDYVIENSTKWNHNLIDDVALASLLSNYGVHPYLNERIDILDDYNIPNHYFHYRLKTGSRVNDIKRMYSIHNIKNKK